MVDMQRRLLNFAKLSADIVVGGYYELSGNNNYSHLYPTQEKAVSDSTGSVDLAPLISVLDNLGALNNEPRIRGDETRG